MEFRRTEVGVGRIMFVQTADAGIAKKNAAAAVGLQAVLVRIDDDGIGFGNFCEGLRGVRCEISRECEVAAVGGIDVDAKAMLLAKSENFRQRINRSGSSSTHGDNYR